MLAILLAIVTLAVDFLFCALIVKILSVLFGFAFSWAIALGCWIILLVIKRVTSK